MDAKKQTRARRPLRDYSQESFGKWTAISYEYANRYVYWKFRCVCGKEEIRVPGDIRKSVKENPELGCGCSKRNIYHELIGYEFNNLKLTAYLGKVRNFHRFNYVCLCGKKGSIIYDNIDIQYSCGCINEIKYPEVRTEVKNYKILQIIHEDSSLKVQCMHCNTIKIKPHNYILNKRTYNCICNNGYNKEIPKEERVWIRLYNKYKRTTERRGREFQLSLIEYKKLILDNCYYCGTEPIEFVHEKYTGKKNGIDRVDSLKGYILDNCVSCCYNCNIMKNDFTQNSFYDHIQKILNHIKEKDDRWEKK